MASERNAVAPNWRPLSGDPEQDQASLGALNRQTLYLLTQSDDNYIQHLSAMLVSLFENNRNNTINVFALISEDISEDRLRQVTDSIPTRSQNLHFSRINREMLSGLRVVNGLTGTVYHKLFMGDTLPRDIGRIIYLDADIIVRADLAELWRYDLKNCIVGAVPDVYVESTIRIKTKLGLRPEASYFNSGVLLVDLDRWRDFRVGLKTVRFVRNHSDRMTFNDQCALNWVLRDHWKPLPECWNLQTFAVTPSPSKFIRYTKEAKGRTEEAKIMHFTGSCKPWHYAYSHPVKFEYLKYISKTQWKAFSYQDYSLGNVIRKNLYRVSPALRPVYHWIRKFTGGFIMPYCLRNGSNRAKEEPSHQ